MFKSHNQKSVTIDTACRCRCRYSQIELHFLVLQKKIVWVDLVNLGFFKRFFYLILLLTDSHVFCYFSFICALWFPNVYTVFDVIPFSVFLINLQVCVSMYGAIQKWQRVERWEMKWTVNVWYEKSEKSSRMHKQMLMSKVSHGDSLRLFLFTVFIFSIFLGEIFLDELFKATWKFSLFTILFQKYLIFFILFILIFFCTFQHH